MKQHSVPLSFFAALTVCITGCGAFDDGGDAGRISRASIGGDRAASGEASRLSRANGLAAVHVAARLGDLEGMRNLAAAGADLDQVDARQTGWTPLLHAVHKDQVAVVTTLLALGADPNLPGSHGMTPLIMAAAYGNAGMVRALLEGGADPRRPAREGDTPLLAAYTGSTDVDRFTLGSCQTETMRALLEYAPDLRLPDSKATSLTRAYHRLRGCDEMEALLEDR